MSTPVTTMRLPSSSPMRRRPLRAGGRGGRCARLCRHAHRHPRRHRPGGHGARRLGWPRSATTSCSARGRSTGPWRCATRSSARWPDRAPRHRRRRQRRRRRRRPRRHRHAVGLGRAPPPTRVRRPARRQGRDPMANALVRRRPGVPAARAAPRLGGGPRAGGRARLPGRRRVPPPAGQGARPPRPADRLRRADLLATTRRPPRSCPRSSARSPAAARSTPASCRTPRPSRPSPRCCSS